MMCCKYKVRFFYSKGTYLVLLCVTLLLATAWTYADGMYQLLFQGIVDVGVYSRIALLPVIPFLIITPLIGWCADTKFGNYKVFKAGGFMLFAATATGCICVLILENTNHNSTLAFALSAVIAPVIYAFGLIGIIACFVTALMLGLDQMPEASSDNISSFIAWCTFSSIMGLGISDLGYTLLIKCVTNHFLANQVYSFLPVGYMSIFCCSLYLFGQKWLIIEPNSPKALRKICHILKIAYRHKVPINRSAFTYWEDNIPSRIDHAKLKYGGPFTTEEVEDVKTFFKVLALLLPLFLPSMASTSINEIYEAVDLSSLYNVTECQSALLYTFTYSPWLSGIISTLLYELLVYPLIYHCIPSIIRRLAILFSVVSAIHIGYAVLSVIAYVSSWETPWGSVMYSGVFGVLFLFISNGITELVCSQSPYNMRSLIGGYSSFLFMIAVSLGSVVYRLFVTLCDQRYCLMLRPLISVVLSVIGTALYLIAARWYKRRVRDDCYDAHRVVEEVYDRYLSQAMNC